MYVPIVSVHSLGLCALLHASTYILSPNLEVLHEVLLIPVWAQSLVIMLTLGTCSHMTGGRGVSRASSDPCPGYQKPFLCQERLPVRFAQSLERLSLQAPIQEPFCVDRAGWLPVLLSGNPRRTFPIKISVHVSLGGQSRLFVCHRKQPPAHRTTPPYHSSQSRSTKHALHDV